MFQVRTSTKLLIGYVLVTTMLVGCSRIRLPAIDPTGARIFQPLPNSTTLVNPFEGALPSAAEMRPAFTRPPSVPACLTPAPVSPLQASTCPAVAPLADRVCRDGQGARRGPSGEIRLFPGRLVAPVGTEVVLRAGLCGDDGYYVTGQPVEWILSQESVGHFVQVGESNHLKHLLTQRLERKISNNFAVARTLAQGRILTRGSADPKDDVQILKGQSWVSMTSAAPGISHVTVVAPKAQEWDRRRRTATVYWVDAEWRLPRSAAIQSGQTAQLTTTVTQASSGSPLTNWIVRYEIENESAATFEDGNKATEQLTDSQGNAVVNMVSPNGQSTSARVRIQIIRPARQGGEIPRMIIGQGWSTITWSSAELRVRVSGPENAATDRPVTYRVEVQNPGNITAESVVLTTTAPGNLEITGSAPAAQTIGERFEWQLGNLAPNTSRMIDVHAVSKTEQNVRLSFQAVAAGGLQASEQAETQFIRPSLKIDADQPAGPFKVGDVVRFKFEVANTGTRALTNVQLFDTFQSGLRHSDGETSPLLFTIGTLEPGKVFRKGVSFQAVQPGQHCHTLRVTADGGQSDSVRRCIDVSPADPPAKPTLSVKIEGPKTQRVNAPQIYDVLVRNPGKTDATNVVLVVNFTPTANPQQYTEGGDFNRAQSRFTWNLTTVKPGDEFVRQVQFSFQATGAHRITASVDSAEQARDQTELVVNAVAAERTPANNNNTGPTQPANNQPPPAEKLELRVTDNTDSIQVGDFVTFDIYVKNNRSRPDQGVVVTVEIPAGLAFEKLTGSSVSPTVSSDQKTITLPLIREMRPGEALPRYRLILKGVAAGDMKVKIRATSRLTDGSVDAEETMSVYK